MSVLIIFIKLIAVFDLLVIAVYFGAHSFYHVKQTSENSQSRKTPFNSPQDAVIVSLSIEFCPSALFR